MPSTAQASSLRHQILRFMAVGLLAVWQGGLTLYGAVVIRIAERVLHSHLPVGFITQRVSNWLNVIGAMTVALLTSNAIASGLLMGRKQRRVLVGSLAVMAGTLAVLVLLHPLLDRVLDAPTRKILDAERFGSLHRAYLITCTVQWLAAVVHLWCLLSIPTPLPAEGGIRACLDGVPT